MALTHEVSRPYLKVYHDFVYQIPFLESLRRHLSDQLVFEEVYMSLIIITMMHYCYVGNEGSYPN